MELIICQLFLETKVSNFVARKVKCVPNKVTQMGNCGKVQNEKVFSRSTASTVKRKFQLFAAGILSTQIKFFETTQKALKISHHELHIVLNNGPL